MCGDFIFANPASQHSDGKIARKSINQSKTFISEFFHLKESEFSLYFHSGATEGLNTIIHHFALRSEKESRPLILAYAQGDHPAVVEACKAYPDSIQFILKRNSHGDYLHDENFSQLKELKDQNPSAIILYHHLWLHNEIGVVSPLSEIVIFKSIPDLFISVDAVQTVGKFHQYRDLDSRIDFYTYSAHKFGALKGIGFSFIQTKTQLAPLLVGGGQQNKLRSGTENAMGVHSIKLALEDMSKKDLAEVGVMKEKLSEHFRLWLKGKGGLVGDKALHLSLNTIYFYLNNLTSDIALAMFDMSGIEISAGSACSSGAAKESEILLSLNHKDVAKNGLRLSLGPSMSESEFDDLVIRLGELFKRIP